MSHVFLGVNYSPSLPLFLPHPLFFHATVEYSSANFFFLSVLTNIFSLSFAKGKVSLLGVMQSELRTNENNIAYAAGIYFPTFDCSLCVLRICYFAPKICHPHNRYKNSIYNTRFNKEVNSVKNNLNSSILFYSSSY